MLEGVVEERKSKKHVPDPNQEIGPLLEKPDAFSANDGIKATPSPINMAASESLRRHSCSFDRRQLCTFHSRAYYDNR